MSTDGAALLARKTWRTAEPLHGMIYFHQGDDSEFVARRATEKKATKRK